jgi:transcriptional regulator with XRE-family HTH domain
MNIGTAIRSIRKKLSISQFELAEMCNLTQTALSQIETGKKRPSHRTFSKICEVLDIPPSIVYIVAMEDTDVSPGKKGVYDLVYPSIKSLAMQMVDLEHHNLLASGEEKTGS